MTQNYNFSKLFSNGMLLRQMSLVSSVTWTIFWGEHSVWKSQKKVSFNIASEASYVYILNGQKFIKNAKNGLILQVFENLKFAVKQCYQTGQFK